MQGDEPSERLRSQIVEVVADAPRGRRLRARRRRRLAELYWAHFLDTPAADPLNLLAGPMREAPEGSINSVRTELHTPEVMTDHVREIARKLGSELVGVLALEPGGAGPPEAPDRARFAVLSVVPAADDPARHPGVGGQAPLQAGLMVSFILAAYFREAGYFATVRAADQAALAGLAVRAGLGRLGPDGRLRTAAYGTRAWVADPVYTDFPLSPGAEVAPD